MMNDERARGLFRIELKLLRETDIDPIRREKVENLFLILKVRAGGIAEAVTRTLISLGEEFSQI